MNTVQDNDGTIGVDERQPSAEVAASLAAFYAAPTTNTPVWLAGNRLAFISDRSGVPQVWVTEPVDAVNADEADGIAVSPLTSLGDRVGSLVASQSGEMIVFGMDSGGNEHLQLWTLTVPGGDPTQASEAQPLTSNPSAIYTLGAISPDGRTVAFSSNERDSRFFDVMTMSLETGQTATVMAQDDLLYPVAWSPSGDALLVRRNVNNLDHDLFLIRGDEREPKLLTPHEGESTIRDVVFAPDGQSLLVATNAGREFSALLRLDLDGHVAATLADPDWDVEMVRASPVSNWMAYSTNEDGVSRLRLRGGTGIDLGVDDLPAGTIDGMEWSPDGRVLVVSITSPVSPGALWLVHLDGTARPVVPPDMGDLDPAALVYPDIIRFQTFDEREIPAFWFVPEGEGPFPVVVDVHGGPESQRRAQWQPWSQFLVQQGFAVLATNVRGSTGYGRTYCHLDDREKRYDSVADLGAAHDWLRRQENVIGDAINIYGVSYGGFMVLAALTTQPERWRTGIDVVGIANFVSFFENTGPWRRKTRAAEYGDPDTQADLLREISPIHRVDQIQAPLFVIHGRNDPRVPLGETEQIVEAVRSKGGVVDFVVFDDEGHGLVKRVNRLRGYGLIMDFLNQWGRPGNES